MDVIAEEWAGRFSAYGDSTLAMLAVIWIRSRLVPRSPTLRPIRKAGTVSEIAVQGSVSRLRRWFGYPDYPDITSKLSHTIAIYG
jgi:hypothetical protein